MVPADHRLASKPMIEITDLADEHLLQDPDAVPEWRDIARRTASRQAEAGPGASQRRGETRARRGGAWHLDHPVIGGQFYQPTDVAAYR